MRMMRMGMMGTELKRHLGRRFCVREGWVVGEQRDGRMREYFGSVAEAALPVILVDMA